MQHLLNVAALSFMQLETSFHLAGAKKVSKLALQRVRELEQKQKQYQAEIEGAGKTVAALETTVNCLNANINSRTGQLHKPARLTSWWSWLRRIFADDNHE